MTTGLSARELELIEGVLRRHRSVRRAIIYGSRAMGRSTPRSDVDLALEGALDGLETSAISSELDELPMPYRFDVTALDAISSTELRDHIARVGIVLF